NATPGGIASFLNNLYKFLIGAAAVLAIIMIIWGGLEISTQDSVSKKSDGKARITQAIFGLVLVLSPVLVFSIINPSILNLSISMSPIDLSTPPPGSGGITAPTTGCTTMQNSGQYLETAICASQSAASAYSCKNGGKPYIPTCKNVSPNGRCLDSAIAWCVGKSITLLYYQYYSIHFKTILSFSSVKPIDGATYTSFANECKNEGGVPGETLSSLTADSSRSVNIFNVSSYSCPANSGIVIDKTQYDGAICFNKTLTCNPPTN
ncbi:MAG: pilin, partial [Minisyncoccota bacterium]